MTAAELVMLMILQAASRAAPWAQGEQWRAISKWWHSEQPQQWRDHFRAKEAAEFNMRTVKR
jgi:hypothetical protein